ncbi:MAG TPA: type II CAAX endopeptidase family protein [Propionibacteriaceae bacterium]|nr:type II CAAX endopeptidase family protein [Propionibacteriaceae bacterium]
MAKSKRSTPSRRANRRTSPARPADQRRPPDPPVPAPVPPAPMLAESLLPRNGVEYPQILRNEGYIWWRSLLGALFGLSLFVLLTAVVSRALVTLFWALTAADTSYADFYAESFAFERALGMLSVNLGLATLIPISWILITGVHQMRPRWLSSVQPRIRWRYLIGCLVIAVVALNGVLLISLTVEPALRWGPQAGFWGFLIVIVLTSPLQAMAEEIFFRGYLLQALGSLVARPWFGVVVSALLFALLHGLQNPALFADRLAFGLLAGVLVWRTGGLEAGIAAHVVNNVCAYLLAGLTTSIAALKAIRDISWLQAGFDIGGFALFAVLAYALSRLMRLRTRVDLAAV